MPSIKNVKYLGKDEDSTKTYYGAKHNSTKIQLELAIQTTQTCGA
jgi:hypothetical protein